VRLCGEKTEQINFFRSAAISTELSSINPILAAWMG
jgi:hypothetical protein